MQWSQSTSGPPDAGLADATMKRARTLSRRRSKLTAEEASWLEANMPQAEALAAQRWYELTKESRSEVLTLAGTLNLEGALAELAGVHPYLSDVETPEEIRQNVLSLAGMEAVGFDAARLAMRTLALLEELLPVWEAVWEDVSVASSVDSAAKQAKANLSQEYTLRGRLKGFLAYYNQTMERVRSCYEKASRLVSVEALRHGTMNL